MALGHWLKDYIGPHSSGGGGGSGGGGTEPLIIRDTEETVQDTEGRSYLLTDTLATDAYEAWQSGRPVYRSIGGDLWAVNYVNEYGIVITIYVDDEISSETIRELPFSSGYLCSAEA